MRFKPIKRNGVRGTEKQSQKRNNSGCTGVLFLADNLRNTDQIHFGPRLNLFKTLVPSVKNGSRSELQMAKFLDYLNACARLRTQRDKVELLVELSRI